MLRRCVSLLIFGVLMIAIGACDMNVTTGGGSVTTAPTALPGSVAFPISSTSPPSLIRGPGGSQCVAVMSGQSTTGNGTLIFDVDNFVDVNRVDANDLVYNFTIQAVAPSVPSCPASATPTTVTLIGPVLGPFTINFAVTYFGSYARSNPVCINGSAIIFRSFDVEGLPALFDPAAQNSARQRIHESFDASMAASMNSIVNGTSATPVPANPRCAGWSELDTSLFANS